MSEPLSAARIAQSTLMSALDLARREGVQPFEVLIAMSAALNEIVDGATGHGSYLALIQSSTELRQQLREPK